MATILTSPASASLVDSPTMVSAVTYDSSGIYNSSSLQHICELYVWDGNKGDQPTTPSYTLKKFPILQSNGYKTTAFDVSPILSSFMSASFIDRYKDDEHNVKWWTVEIYEQAKDGSLNVITGSHATLDQPRIGIDGYNKWGEKRDLTGASTGSGLYNFPNAFPFLTVAPLYPTTQTIYRTDLPFYYSVYARYDGDIGNVPEYRQEITSVLPIASGVPQIGQTVYGAQAQVTSSYVIQDFMVTPTELQSWEGSGYDEFSLLLRSGSSTIYPEALIQFNLECQKKYTPQRIVFRNRFGGLDQFDFNLVSRNSFNVETRTYNQQKFNNYGTTYDMGVGETTYTSEGHKNLTVNTDYLGEEWNEFFEDMLLSKEIYLVQPETSQNYDYGQFMDANLIPLTVETKTFAEKKEEVDKLIQYTFTFKYSVPHKLKL